MPPSKFDIGDEVYILRGQVGSIVNKTYGLVTTRQQISGLQMPQMKWSYQIAGQGFTRGEWYVEDTLTKAVKY